jgi:hypothetical protein
VIGTASVALEIINRRVQRAFLLQMDVPRTSALVVIMAELAAALGRHAAL